MEVTKMNKNISNLGSALIVGLFILLSFGGVSADEWQMFHHDISQSGYSISHAPSYNNTIWKVDGGQLGAVGSPVIFNGTVFFVSNTDSRVHAISEANGSEIWNKPLPDLIWHYTVGTIIFDESATPTVVNDRLLIPTRNCTVYALDISTGDEIWSTAYGTDEVTASYLTVKDGNLYMKCHGETNDTIHVANIANGEENEDLARNYTHYMAGTQNPTIEGNLLYMSVNPCEMDAIDMTNGEIIWNYTIESGCSYAGLTSPMITNGKIVFGSDAGYVYMLNKMTGEEINVINIGEGAYEITAGAGYGMIFIGTGIRGVYGTGLCQLYSTNGSMFALNETDGSILWSVNIGDAIHSSPSVADHKVFFGARNNNFYALNVSNGNIIWTYRVDGTRCAITDGILSSPAIANGAVVTTTSLETIAFKTLTLVFVMVDWDDGVPAFNEQVTAHANRFREVSGLNDCNGLQVDIRRVTTNVPGVNNPVCDTLDAQALQVLQNIKEWAFVNNSVKGDRYIGLTTEEDTSACDLQGWTVRPPSEGSDTVVLKYSNNITTSHELGHTYGLCDEYCYDVAGYQCWTDQNAGYTCPNSYPCLGNEVGCAAGDENRSVIHGICAAPEDEIMRFHYYDPDSCTGLDLNFTHSDSGYCVDLDNGRLPAPEGYCTDASCANACNCDNNALSEWNTAQGTALTQYPGGIGECSGYNGVIDFMCWGYRFGDGTFSIMGPSGIPSVDYSPDSFTYIDHTVCGNAGFFGAYPTEHFFGTSGMATSGLSLKISLAVDKDKNVKFDDVDVGEAYVPGAGVGDYSIVLKDESGSKIYVKSFDVPFYGIGEPAKRLNETKITLSLPYYPEIMDKIEVLYKDGVLAEQDVGALNNGGFETGDLTAWTAGGPGDHKVDTQVPHTGNYSALIGFREHGNVANGYDHIYQTIKVPSGKESELSFNYRFYSYDYCNYDFFTMHIRDENGNVLVTPVNRCLGGNGLEDTGWTEVKYNLTQYAGQKIQMYFEVSNRYDTAYNSWAYIDDVSVTSISQLTNNGFETGNLTGWNVGGDGCYANWVTIVNSSAKPGLVRSGNYAVMGNAAWTGSYSNPWCTTGWYCPEDAILSRNITVPSFATGYYLDFYTMIQTGSSWQSHVKVTVKDMNTGEIFYGKGNGVTYSGYSGLECPPGNCNAGGGNGCTEPNDNWQYHHVNLSGHEGHTLQLYFRSHSCCWCSVFYVDDVCIADSNGNCI